jgi:hypothetical protein
MLPRHEEDPDVCDGGVAWVAAWQFSSMFIARAVAVTAGRARSRSRNEIPRCVVPWKGVPELSRRPRSSGMRRHRGVQVAVGHGRGSPARTTAATSRRSAERATASGSPRGDATRLSPNEMTGIQCALHVGKGSGRRARRRRRRHNSLSESGTSCEGGRDRTGTHHRTP